MAPTRLLVLGIDGASPRLLRQWSASGDLPNLAALLARGRSSSTQGLDGFFIGSTWPSIYTGSSPARHGFHYQVQIRPGTYELHSPVDEGLFSGPPFWRVLSDAGRRVAILDAPMSPIDSEVNGIQVVEWGGHDALYGFRAHPPQLVESIQSRYGSHPAGVSCDGARRTATDYESFVNSLLQGVETKLRMTREMLGKDSWDLFMQVFSEAHCVGHQCWHLHDEGHPAHDPAISRAIGDPVLRVYRSIDFAIGKLLEDAGDCTTFVFSSHGMAHWYGAEFLLAEILFKLGVSCRSPVMPRAQTPADLALAAGTRAWHLLPTTVRQRLRSVRNRFGPGAPGTTARPEIEADVTRSRCFHQRNGLALGGIRLNLVGREPHGMLRPGPEADTFCKDLIDDLRAVIDERTGRPLIRRVVRVAEHYRGPRLSGLPDLVVDYDDALATGSTQLAGGAGATLRVSSPKIGVIEGSNSYGRTGEHRPDGLLIATGPGLHHGKIGDPPSVLDLAPTWTRLLGVEMPEAEGAAIEALTGPA